MKISKIVLIAVLIGISAIVKSQNGLINGTVYELSSDKKEPLTGVNIYWAGTQKGTVTDTKGNFKIERLTNGEDHLVFSFIGYKKDTVQVAKELDFIEIILSVNHMLEEVVITNKHKGSYLSRLDPKQTQNITGTELQKAACCNLSESFETNASVDVSYSDAVSGAKQIMLLGLAGIYSQMMTENIPNLKGLSSTFGLGYIPGPWMESIQVSKGASSVVNGFESVTGQINIEYKKPDNSEKLYLNLYSNRFGKIEGNANTSVKMNKKWSTMLFAHAENLNNKTDENSDGFIDMPLVKQINIFNRWKYKGDKGLRTQFGIKLLDEERTGGQVSFSKNSDADPPDSYGIEIKTKRYEAFWKMGYLIPDKVHTSIALINSINYHEQNSVFGINSYEGKQKSYYSNLIFQSFINNTNHKFKTGLSFQYDEYIEYFNDTLLNREESVPGSFFQYTYSDAEKVTLLAGIRFDYHNIFGSFFTPRLHLKYDIDKNTILRASAGKGYRTPNVFADNSFLLASSRVLVLPEKIQMEEAINYGINVTRYFNIAAKQLTLNLEFYRTDFINQLIADRDQDITKVIFYNLNGKSYSNSFQIELNYELFERFDIVAAYRYSDVKTTINEELVRKPLVNRYKGLLNLSYATNFNKWQFDFTTQFNGDSRLPSTINNPEEYQRDSESPEYIIINFQITKFYKIWSVYIGCENLTNFTQDDPIIAANDPFGNNFDASMVWGPIVGRKLYIGLRFALK